MHWSCFGVQLRRPATGAGLNASRWKEEAGRVVNREDIDKTSTIQGTHVDQALQERLDEVEENHQASMMIAVAAMTELLCVTLSLLIKKKALTAQEILLHLDRFQSGLNPTEEDSPEMKLGKEVLVDSVNLIRQRVRVGLTVQAPDSSQSSPH